MKELTLKRRLNTYLYRGYPGISSNFENGTKQLEAQLEKGVAYIKTSSSDYGSSAGVNLGCCSASKEAEQDPRYRWSEYFAVAFC